MRDNRHYRHWCNMAKLEVYILLNLRLLINATSIHQ
jgi:hypothetical protein